MIVYGIIMLAVALLFAVLAVQIYRGNTQLIHDYHQMRVTDRVAYGKAFGKAMGWIAGGMALSGCLSFLGEGLAWLAVAALLLGLIVGFIAIARVQKQYNGGIF